MPITSYNVVLTTQSTEYSQALPAGTYNIMFKTRDGTAIYYAWETGKVAGPTANYFTLQANAVYNGGPRYRESQTIYFACPSAGGKVVEMETWQ